ncbi:hypothetical protein ACFPYI_03115 [Halomarina salina]|uniref:Amphi-Trp domain-containing protein n=1 Tax=Halomarina salina TaxID=1872699 RepID=A0ABD5RIL9_9EURY|nr:hypothetical protein [Halomarina salina]
MFDSTKTIDSDEAFAEALTRLIDTAESTTVDVRGGYDIETTDRRRYDVVITDVEPTRD